MKTSHDDAWQGRGGGGGGGGAGRRSSSSERHDDKSDGRRRRLRRLIAVAFVRNGLLRCPREELFLGTRL